MERTADGGEQAPIADGFVDRRTVRWKLPLFTGIGIVALASGLGLLIRMHEVTSTIDVAWMEAVLPLRSPVADAIALGLNWLGGGIIAVLVVPIITAIVLILTRRRWGALYFVIAAALSAGTVQVLKSVLGRARPEDIIITSDFGSFPSGHVANAATIAVAVGIIVPRAWVWLLGIVYTVLMALSRTYLGAHWLSDTVGGALLGVGIGLLVWVLFAVVLTREQGRALARRQLSATAHRDGTSGERSRIADTVEG